MANWDRISDVDMLWLQDNSGFPQAGTIVSCLMCAKPFLMRPYSGVPDQICPECFKTYNECASLMCVHCRVVIAKIKPGVTDTGYYVRPRAVLHADKCLVCDPDVVESRIIEMDEWYRQVGLTKKTIIPIRLNKVGGNTDD